MPVAGLVIPERLEKIVAKKRRLRGLLDITLDSYSLWLPTSRFPFFPDYTDHRISHINQVLATAVDLIRAESWKFINEEDAFVLCLGVLLHDVAMHMELDGFRNLILGKTPHRTITEFDETSTWPELWKRYVEGVKRFSPQDWENVTGSPSPVLIPDAESSDWLDSQYRFAGEFIRQHHPRLAHEIALYGFPSGTKARVLTLPPDLSHLADLSGLVARSHGLPLIRSAQYLQRKYSDEIHPCNVRVVFLMALLRVSDYLHLQSDRAPMIREQVESIRSPVSRKEWIKHRAIVTILPDGRDPEAIRVHLNPENEEIARDVLALLSAVQSELDSTWRCLAQTYGNHRRYKALGLVVRRIVHNLADDGWTDPANRLKVSERKRNPDEERVMRFLHELKHPIILIRAAAEMLSRQLAEIDSKREKLGIKDDYLEDISGSADLMMRLIEDFSYGALGAAKSKREELRLAADIIAPVLHQARILVHRRVRAGERSAVHVDLDHLPCVMGDKRQLQQALWAVINNAIRYSYVDQEHFRVEITGHRTGAFVEIQIRNWGIGIPQEEILRVFDLGFRGSAASLVTAGGSGMGLWIAKQLVEANGGRIAVSRYESPTEITVTLRQSSGTIIDTPD
jgi:signal transduction histidine kinase